MRFSCYDLCLLCEGILEESSLFCAPFWLGWDLPLPAGGGGKAYSNLHERTDVLCQSTSGSRNYWFRKIFVIRWFLTGRSLIRLFNICMILASILLPRVIEILISFSKMSFLALAWTLSKFCFLLFFDTHHYIDLIFSPQWKVRCIINAFYCKAIFSSYWTIYLHFYVTELCDALIWW